MHVLHVIDGLGLGGAERMLVDLANQTVKDGHRVSVCVTRSDLTMREELAHTIQLLVLRRRSRISPGALWRLARFIANEAVDVLHVHLRSNLAFVLQLRATGLVRVPIVFHDHYGTIEIDASIPSWFRLGQRFVDHYVGVYDKLTNWAGRAGIEEARRTTIPNVIDTSRFMRPTDEDVAPTTGPLRAIQVATLRRDKGIEVLLEAVQHMRHRDKVHITVAGADGEPEYARDMRRRSSALRLTDTIQFLGGRNDVPALLARSQIGILTSHTESGPLVLVEYLASGIPIASTRVGDIGRRLSSLGVPGFVDPGDGRALARELDLLVTMSSNERATRARLGREVITSEWDISSNIGRWYDIYRRVIRS